MAFRPFVGTSSVLLPAVALLLLSGCGGQNRPSDLPPLYPCTVTVTQDGKPLGEGIVTFVSTDTSFKWAVFAQLNTSGTGKVFTQGLYSGAPEGEYKVVISKQETISEQIGPAIVRQGEFGEETTTPTILTVYSLVEKDYTDAATTPLSITVARKGNDQKFDCGKPARELLHKITP